MDPATSSVSSRFVSEKQLTEAQQKRQEEWKATYAKLGQEPPPDVGPPGSGDYDGRSLWEKLQEHKNKKQEAFDEALKFKNQFRALDEDEINFLDSMTDENNEEELARQKEIKDELRMFKQAVSSRSVAPLPISISAISPTLTASTSTAGTSTNTTKKPLPPPPKKKKNLLAGVVVKKKAPSPAGASSSPGEKGSGSLATKTTTNGSGSGLKRSTSDLEAAKGSEESATKDTEADKAKRPRLEEKEDEAAQN